jgi:tetratricopeptide (TPR) repeat protein
MESGNYDIAEKSFSQSLDIRKKLSGGKDLLYIEALMNMARLYRKEKKYGMSAQYYYDAIKVRKELDSEDNIGLAVNLHELSQMLIDAGKIEEAAKIAEKSLEIRKNVYGKNHPRYARGMYYLSQIYMKCGRIEEALNLLISALGLQNEYVGEKSNDYKDTLDEIIDDELKAAEIYSEKSNIDIAVEHFETAKLYINKKNEYDYTKLNVRFANLTAKSGHIDEAFNMLDNAEKDIIQKNGECSGEYTDFLIEKGKVLITSGDLKKAESCLFKCIETDYLLGSDVHKDEIFVILGNAYIAEEDIKNARKYFSSVSKNSKNKWYPIAQEGLKLCDENEKDIKLNNVIAVKEELEKNNNTETKEYADTVWQLGKVCESCKNDEDAEKLYNISIDKRRSINALEDDFAKNLIRLASVMKKNGHIQEAAGIFEEAAEHIKSEEGECAQYAKTLLRAAKAEADCSNIMKAEKLFEKVRKVMLHIFGENDDSYLAVCYDITVFYIKCSNKRKAGVMFEYLIEKIAENENSMFSEDKYQQKLNRLADKIKKM